MPAVADLVTFLEQFAPPSLAADLDNVGLLLGQRDAPVHRVMTCLTVTPESAREAIAEQVQLIVTHHPILFRAIKSLTDEKPEGRMLLELARAGVAVYSPHTAFDNTRGGINDLLCTRLGLRNVVPLRRQDAERQCKLVVFVPDADLARVADALFAAGAGRIGQYRECSFRLAGTGTFFGTEAANPTVGQKGRREEVAEWRLEVVCQTGNLQTVVSALRKAHSYEEPAFDIYPLHSMPGAGGEGRMGLLAELLSLRLLAELVRTALACGPVQFVGDPQKEIRKVAIVCGAGGEMLSDAVRAEADAFLTGEMRFHDYLAAQSQNLALILPGHYATERPGVEDLARRLQESFPGIQVWAGRQESDPAKWI